MSIRLNDNLSILSRLSFLFRELQHFMNVFCLLFFIYPLGKDRVADVDKTRVARLSNDFFECSWDWE